MKRKILATVITLCMAFAACFALVACAPDEQKAASFVSLDINPSIELTLDSHDKVLSVRGANEDGQVLLYNEADLKGLSVEAAVEKITELAVEYGYLDEDNKVVQTSVIGDKRVESILSKVNAKVTATAEKLNVAVSCEGLDEAFSLSRRLDNLKAAYPDSQAIQTLTPSRLKLVISASETGTVSIEAAAELDTSELLAIVTEAYSQTEQYATAAYAKAKTAAEDAYLKTKSAAIDAIYLPYFAAKHPLETYYVAAYTGYSVSAVAANALADVMFYAEQACTTPLDEAQIAKISQALNLGDNVDCLKNSQGEITVKSIEAYADKAFKNSEANETLQQVKTALTSALNEAETAIQAEIDEFNEKYRAELEQIEASLTSAAEQIQGLVSNLLPDEAKQQINAMVADMTDVVKEISGILSDGKITSDEVRALANKLSDKAAAARKTMEGKLTESELEEVARLQAQAEEKLSNAKKQMDEAIAQAEEQAKAYLQRLKDARANAGK